MIVWQAHTGNIDTMVYSPDSRTLLSGSADGQVKLWDLSTFKERAHFSYESRKVSAVDFTPDGARIVANPGNWFRTLVIWDTVLGQVQQQFSPPFSAHHCLFANDGKMVVFSGGMHTDRDGKRIYPIGRWNVATKRMRRMMVGHTDQIGYLAASRDGRLLVSGSADRSARVWDLNTGKELACFKHKGWLYGLAFSPCSKLLATSAGLDVLLWDLTKRKKAGTLSGHKRKVRSLAFLPDGRTLLSAAEDGLIFLWDLAGRKQTAVFDWNIEGLLTVAVATNGMTAAAASAKGAIVLWDLDER